MQFLIPVHCLANVLWYSTHQNAIVIDNSGNVRLFNVLSRSGRRKEREEWQVSGMSAASTKARCRPFWDGSSPQGRSPMMRVRALLGWLLNPAIWCAPETGTELPLTIQNAGRRLSIRATAPLQRSVWRCERRSSVNIIKNWELQNPYGNAVQAIDQVRETGLFDDQISAHYSTNISQRTAWLTRQNPESSYAKN